MKPTAEKSAGSSHDLRYRGVRKRKWGKYVSEIRLPNSRNRIWLGSYDSAEKAARAFDAAMFCLRGKNARFNFPDDPPNIPGGESLQPSEIQAAAARFANEVPHAGVRETSSISGYASPSSVSDGGFPADGDLTGDWSSFLDSLGPPDSECSADAAQFGSFFNEFDNFSGEIDLPPVETDFAPDIGFSQQSFLWNF